MPTLILNTRIGVPPEDRLAKPPAHLHIPTARGPLELVLWHLVADWSVTPKTDDWRAVLGESLEGFEQRRMAS